MCVCVCVCAWVGGWVGVHTARTDNLGKFRCSHTMVNTLLSSLMIVMAHIYDSVFTLD